MLGTGKTTGMRMQFLMDRTAALLRLREHLSPHSASLRRAALFVAFLGFAAGLFWAAESVSSLWTKIALFPLVVLLLIGVPLTISLSAAEYRAMLEAAGSSVPWRAALEISIYTSAANMLPIPGGVITRLGGMKARGISIREGSRLVVLFAGIWAGTAFSLSGAAIALHNASFGAVFLGAGLAALILSIQGLHSRGAGRCLIVKIVLIRTASQVVEMARLILAFRALGTVLPFADAAVFAVSSFVGTAVSIVPAGIGINEGIVALLSPVIGLNPATGFIAAAINRVVVMAGLALVASILLSLPGHRNKDGVRAQKRTERNSDIA